MSAKKILLLFFTFILLTGCIQDYSITLNPSLSKKVTKAGNILYNYSITNIGDKEVELVFGTWLEYNVGFGYLGEEKYSLNLTAKETIEHLDLERNEASQGRTVILKPNDSLNYTIKIKTDKLPNGEYDFSIGVAPGNINEPIYTRMSDIFSVSNPSN